MLTRTEKKGNATENSGVSVLRKDRANERGRTDNPITYCKIDEIDHVSRQSLVFQSSSSNHSIDGKCLIPYPEIFRLDDIPDSVLCKMIGLQRMFSHLFIRRDY